MKAIGVRELRQHASRFLRLAEAGRTVEITVRGRTVAVLSPAGHTGRRDLLIARGRLDPGADDLLDLGPPPRGTPGRAAPSDLLRRARAGER
jgi:prevent-host-death family protein